MRKRDVLVLRSTTSAVPVFSAPRHAFVSKKARRSSSSLAVPSLTSCGVLVHPGISLASLIFCAVVFLRPPRHPLFRFLLPLSLRWPPLQRPRGTLVSADWDCVASFAVFSPLPSSAPPPHLVRWLAPPCPSLCVSTGPSSPPMQMIPPHPPFMLQSVFFWFSFFLFRPRLPGVNAVFSFQLAN
eukprot:RCo004422